MFRGSAHEKKVSDKNECNEKDSDVLTVAMSEMQIQSQTPTASVEENTRKSNKPTTKAERRALQEAQRAAKAARKAQQQQQLPDIRKNASSKAQSGNLQKGLSSKTESSSKTVIENEAKETSELTNAEKVSDGKVEEVKSKKSVKAKSITGKHKKSHQRHSFVQFKHMKFYSKERFQEVLKTTDYEHVHPSFLRLGTKILTQQIGSDEEKCFLLLKAIEQLIQDFVTPSNKHFPRALLSTLEANMKFLESCRPLTMHMMNCTWHIKMLITHLFFNVELSEEKARNLLVEAVKRCLREKVYLAQRDIAAAIINNENDVISDADTVLIVDCSPFIIDVVIALHKAGKNFHLLLTTDSTLPRCYLDSLLKYEVAFSVVPMDSLVYVLNSVNKILATAAVLFSDGRAYGSVALSQILDLTSVQTTSLILCCETYKFTEEVVPDIMEMNEMQDNDLFNGNIKSESKCLYSFNLKYDLIEADRINRVICEMGEIPSVSCSSIYRLRIKEPTLPPLTSIS